MERRGIAVIEALLRRQQAPYRCIGVRPVSPLIGAEIEGLDLAFPLSAAEVAELRRAFLEHHVLVFRDQHLSAEDHRKLIALLASDPQPSRLPPVLYTTDGGQTAVEPLGFDDCWRADQTYEASPPAGAAMHVQKLAQARGGGDMLFANMHLAYELLSDPLKALLQDLTAVHRRDLSIPTSDPANETAEHPVVVRHPTTGRPAIFVNRRHTSHIVQLDPAQSEATLDMLCRHLESNPVLTCRIRWTPNTLVVWDNRSTQHLTLQDIGPEHLQGRVAMMAGGAPSPFGGPGNRIMPREGTSIH